MGVSLSSLAPPPSSFLAPARDPVLTLTWGESCLSPEAILGEPSWRPHLIPIASQKPLQVPLTRETTAEMELKEAGFQNVQRNGKNEV